MYLYKHSSSVVNVQPIYLTNGNWHRRGYDIKRLTDGFRIKSGKPNERNIASSAYQVNRWLLVYLQSDWLTIIVFYRQGSWTTEWISIWPFRAFSVIDFAIDALVNDMIACGLANRLDNTCQFSWTRIDLPGHAIGFWLYLSIVTLHTNSRDCTSYLFIW